MRVLKSGGTIAEGPALTSKRPVGFGRAGRQPSRLVRGLPGNEGGTNRASRKALSTVRARFARHPPIEPGVKARYSEKPYRPGAETHHMIRSLFRILGFLSLAGGFIALVYDGTKSIAGGALVLTPLGQLWNNVHSTSLQLLQAAIERHVEPRVGQWLWDPVVLSILTAPACLVLGVLGAILMLIGRKKKPLIGYARD